MTDKISVHSFLGADLNRDWRVRKVSKSLQNVQIYLIYKMRITLILFVILNISVTLIYCKSTQNEVNDATLLSSNSGLGNQNPTSSSAITDTSNQNFTDNDSSNLNKTRNGKCKTIEF